MRIAITGAGGQLGTELGYQLGSDAIMVSHAAMDVTNRDAVIRFLTNIRPDAVINAAAFTNVDGAEENKKLCRKINVNAVGYLAEACTVIGCPLVHISSDYVFGGEAIRRKPYRETDRATPQGVYARSKLAGEARAAETAKHFIVRTCGVYGLHEDLAEMTNFVNTMLRLSQDRQELQVVNDQTCTPTFVSDLVAAIQFLLTTEKYGLYHVVNQGETTWYDFAAEIFRLAEVDVSLRPVTSAEFAAKAKRPTYSTLDTTKYHALGGPKMPSWRDALNNAIAKRPALAACH